ncbi:MAG TPA: HAD family phosphatase [Candidatus Paceibacterota bacterium]|nr:HAD family phosphatase [Candidatus Paceibacterota bacterium]HQB26815.1 HAD family phosphatase [Candidatus Paceibacterota bacterium]
MIKIPQVKKIKYLLEQSAGALFDLDGVLVDSSFSHGAAKKMATEKFFPDVLSEKKWLEIKELSTSQVFEKLIAVSKYQDIKKSDFLDFKTNKYSELVSRGVYPLPGAVGFLEELKRQNYQLGLVTATRKENLKFIKLDLDYFFKTVVTAEDVKMLKPAPEAYEIAAARLDLKPTQCVVFEDTDIGLISAQKAGCRTVGRVGTLDVLSLQKAGAEAVFNSFGELVDYPTFF